MSLMRLLTSGKTLVGLHGTPRRYRMSDPRSMPSFNAGQDFYTRVQRGELGQGQSGTASAVALGKVELVQMELTGKEAPSTRIQAPENSQASNFEPQSSEKFERKNSHFQATCEDIQVGMKVEEVPTYDIQVASDGLQHEGDTGNVEMLDQATQKQNPSTNIQAPEKLQTPWTRLQNSIDPSSAEDVKVRQAEGDRRVQSAKLKALSAARSAQHAEPVTQCAEESRRLGPARAARGPFFSHWAERLGAWLPMRARPARAARTMTLPQQGELALSLDEVKVMRNDLSDCDVEIVAPQKQKSPNRPGESRKQKAEVGDQASEIEGQRPEVADQRAEEGGVEAEEILRGGTKGSVGMWGRATRQWFGNPFAKAIAQPAEVLPSAGAD